MKKSLLLLPITLLSITVLTGCGKPSGELKLTYGSLIDETYTDLTYANLESKIDQDENFFLVTYPGKDSTCSCWRVFEMLINSYVKNNVEIIYGVDVYQIIGKSNTFNLSLSESSPSIALFKKGRLIEQIPYSVKSPQPFYKDYAELIRLIDEKTEEPDAIYVDQNIIDNAIADKEDFVIMHTYSSCPDCSYCLPNVIAPYVVNNDLEEDIWIIDLNNIKDDKTLWQQYKDNYGLSASTNNKFGYNLGYVPTAQAYKNGVLVSASVYFNDTVTYENNEYKILDSFYSEERIANLDYLNDFEGIKIIEGMTLSSDDVNVYNDFQYVAWKQDKANQYHKPLLEAFLNYYTK